MTPARKSFTWVKQGTELARKDGMSVTLRAPRYPCALDVVLETPGGETAQARIRDLSRTGFAVEFPEASATASMADASGGSSAWAPALEAGAEVELRFSPPFPLRPVMARVVRRHRGAGDSGGGGGQGGAGFEFSRIGHSRLGTEASQLAQEQVDDLIACYLGGVAGDPRMVDAVTAEADGRYEDAARAYQALGHMDKAAAMLIAAVDEASRAQGPPVQVQDARLGKGSLGKGDILLFRSKGAPAPGPHTDEKVECPLFQTRYVKHHEIGRGGMGVVYLATDTLLSRHVAYKVLHRDFHAEPEAWDRFVCEARAVARLNHPGIVNIHDLGRDGAEHYMVLEYVEGANLRELIVAHGRFEADQAVDVLAQAGRALHHAHERGILHLDVKPGNFMLTAEGVVKTLDFGLARVLEEQSLSASRIVGTPQYLAPEQVTGKGMDRRVDVYALGVSAFHLLTGELPFTGADVTYHHLHTPPPSPTELVPSLPPALCRAVLRCMAKDKHARYATAEEAARAFEEGLG